MGGELVVAHTYILKHFRVDFLYIFFFCVYFRTILVYFPKLSTFVFQYLLQGEYVVPFYLLIVLG